MDVLSKRQRSFCMSQVRSRNSTPEIIVRRALRDLNIKYRLNSCLPGKPDLLLPGAKVAIFVDGCFWHGCKLHLRLPKSNIDYWTKKITRNVERDKKMRSALRRRGYTVIRVWEHETRNGSRLIIKLRKLLC